MEGQKGMKLIGTCKTCKQWTGKESGQIDGHVKRECENGVLMVAETIGYVYPPDNFGCIYWEQKP